MKVFWVLVVGLVLGIVLESESAPPRYVVGPWVSRGRMAEGNYVQDEDDDDVEDEDDDDDDDEQDDDAIYPPDFSKLFPNPDNRPAGPESGHDGHPSHHPTSTQQGRPGYGPASMQGPASLRGPSQAQHGQKLGGLVRPGMAPASRRYRAPPSRPQYRHALNSEEVAEVPVYRHEPVYRQVSAPVAPGWYWVPSSRQGSGRVYNPWANPLRPDNYNPQFVYNPTEMISRRRFRYHPSQRLPYQRIPIYSGHWGNPRHSYPQSGASYTSPWAYRY